MNLSLSARRWFATAATAVLATAAAILGTSGPALAVPTYQGYIYEGPSVSYGFFQANYGTDTFTALSNPVGTTTGKCLDQWFDWGVGANHFDARVARSCKSNYNRSSGSSTETYDVVSYNKVGACYGNNNATTSGTCEFIRGSKASLLPSFPNTCTRAWWRTSGGTLMYGSGGNSTSCTS